MFERIYFRSQNLERDRFRILSHLVEKAGGFTKAVSKQRDYEQAKRYLAKMFAWYCALLRALGPLDLEARVWEKFPRCCPYCLEDECVCASYPERPEPQPALVIDMAHRRFHERPTDLVRWQQMFERIYNQSGYGIDDDGRRKRPSRSQALSLLDRAFSRTVEELGEVAEAMRLEEFYPDHLRNEIADVFAWTCALSNVLPLAFGESGPLYLADVVWKLYPNQCPDCGNSICTCRLEPVRAEISRAGIYADGVDVVTQVQIRNVFEREYGLLTQESPDGATGLLLMDLDNFKVINDTAPARHRQGDAVLRAVASTAAQVLEGHGRLYRFGGDEFVAILRGISAGQERELADALDSAVAALVIPDVDDPSHEYRITASVGSAHESACADRSALLSTADEDMYARKEARRAGAEAAEGDDSEEDDSEEDESETGAS